MHEYFKINYQNWKTNWKTILIRFIIYIIGVFLFGMGIALYLNTKVGASHIDITSFAVIALFKGLMDDGSLKTQGLAIYSLVLLIFYLLMLVVVVGLRATNAIITYRKTQNKQVFISATVNSILDIIPAFVWSYFIKLNQLYIPVDAIGQLDAFVRTWIFMAGFFLYCVGLTLTVFAHMLFGPYNGLSLELHNLTKWDYKLCRVIVDITLMMIGVIIMLINTVFPWDVRERWFGLYFGFGTIFMTFIAGPIIGIMLHWARKTLKIETWFTKHKPERVDQTTNQNKTKSLN